MGRRQRIESAALDAVARAEALAHQLAQQEAPALRTLLTRLVERHPELIAGVSAGLESPAVRKTVSVKSSFDPKPIRDQIRAEFRETARHFSYGDVTLPRLMDELVGDAQAWINKGDGATAVALLEVVASEFIDDDNWVEFDNESDFAFGHLGAVFADALLDPDLSPTVRRDFAPKLERWQRQLNDYCGGDEFDLSQEAAAIGWDGPVLKGLLDGRVPAGFWGEDRRLTRARIGFLEQRGLPEVALRVAQVANLPAAAAHIALGLAQWETVEAEAGRIQEPTAVLDLVKTLGEAGQAARALKIAHAELERCLTTADPDVEDGGWEDDGDDEGEETIAAPLAGETYCYPLALWVRDTAANLGATAMALTAARKAVVDQPSLSDWNRFLELAGPELEAERAAVLARLSKAPRYGGATGQVDILLHEGQGAVAWHLYQSSRNDTLVERIATAVVEELPEEIAAAGRRFAEEIMDSGSSGHYDEAQRWLRLVRTALLAQDKASEWGTYFSHICSVHARKYKLMGLLRAL